jgi:DNA-binding MarR family transcriptional regulator
MSRRHQHDLSHLLSQAERAVTQRLDTLLQPEGSSVEQWRVLQLLSDGADHPMSEVARFALLSGPTLTRLVDRMVSDRLLSRRVDDQDRRRVLVHLTARGQRQYRRLLGVVEDHQAEFIETAGGDVTRLGSLLASLADQFGSIS